MHKLEKEALEDPFLNDALEGYLAAKQVNQARLSILQERLHERIVTQPEERSKLMFSWQRIGVAGVAGLLFVLSCVLLWMTNYIRTENKDDLKAVAVEITSPEELAKYLPATTVSGLAENNAIPEKGWGYFNQYVNEEFNRLKDGESFSGRTLAVYFSIDDKGKAYALKLAENDEKLNRFIGELLDKGPKWHGSTASIQIRFH